MTTSPPWYARPDGEGATLRRTPRLASWNKANAPDQERLREYLEDTAALLAPTMVSSGPWALALDVGLPVERDLLDMADLDNYAYPLATRLCNERLVSVWCTKRHADTSRVFVAPAQETAAPDRTYAARTTASAESSALQGADPLGRGQRFTALARPRPAPHRFRRLSPAQLDQPLEAHHRRLRPTARPHAPRPGLASQ